MPNKNGVVSIGLNVDYQKSLQEMTNDFKAKLTALSNEAKKVNFSKDIADQLDNINKRIDGITSEFKGMFDNLNTQKIDSSNFEKYQVEITKRFEKIGESISDVATKISGLEERLGMLDGSDFATSMKRQFDELSQSVLSTYQGLEKVLDLTKVSSGTFGNINTSALKEYRTTLAEIEKAHKEINKLDFSASSDDDLFENLSKQEELLKEQVSTYKELKSEINLVSKASPEHSALENSLVRVQAAILRTSETIQVLDSEIATRDLGAGMEDDTANIIASISRFDEELDNFVGATKKMIQANKDIQTSVEQTQTTFNTFQIKNGAIHVPVEVATKDGTLKKQLQEAIDKLQEHAKKTPIIAKVKLTLDGSSSKGYKTNAEIDKQQVEGQNEPSIDIQKAMDKASRAAVRNAEQAVKQSIKTIQTELAEVKVKIIPESEAFVNELTKMVNSALEKISKEGFKLNVNEELSKLVESLKEASTSLTGSEGFKFGLDETSINRITDAVENMAHMIQRAFKVASDSDIAEQWATIESKFKGVAGEEGKLLKGNKEHKVAIQELAVEYKKYLDMGGQNDLSALTKHKQTIKNITQEYENLGKVVQETVQKQKKQSTSTQVSKETSEAIKATSRANKTLETQADNTSTAIENEGNVAQTASTKFRKLAKEKGAAVVANRELAKAAKETADALEREANAKKSGAGKTSKNAVDDITYADNFLKWQSEIKQSLLDSGDYAEVYDAKITQATNGNVKFTAVIRDLDGELKKFSATVKDSGKISSPSISDMSEKQAADFEKNLIRAKKVREALAAMDGEDTESTFFNRTDLEGYVSAIIKATQELETFDTTYKVALKNDGSLSITKEVKTAGEEVKKFTANFDSVNSVVDKVEDSVGNVTFVVKDLAQAMEESFDSGRFTTSTNDFNSKAQEALDKFKLKYRGDLNLGEINSDLQRLEQIIGSIGSKKGLDEFKQDLSDLGVRLKNLKADANLGSLFSGNSTQTFSDINEVKNNLNSLFATMGKVNEKSIRVKNMKTLTADIKQANGEIHKMTVNLDSNGFARFVDNGIAQFGRLREAAESVFKGIQSLVRIYLSPQDFIRYFRQGFDTVKEIDTSMTELKKVSDASGGELAAYFDDAVISAKELGSSVNDMISATADWSRMGYNLPDSKELGEVAVLYKNVGDGIDIEEANSSLVSTLQGFQMEASEAERIIDSFNEVSNNFAISSGGIGEALKRSAAAFNVANTDLNKSIALVTATNEVIQNPEKVGTLYQTVSARIRGAKAELEEMGADTDDMVESTSKLRDLVMGMTDFDIMEDENTYKDIYEIIMGIGEEWGKLKDIDRAALLEALAGKRQSNALAAVLANLENLEKAYNTAENSAGSAQREQAKYMDSLQYSLDQLTAHGEEFWTTFINKDDVKTFIDNINILISGATKLVDTFGSIPTVAGILGGFAAIKNIGRPKMFGLKLLF